MVHHTIFNLFMGNCDARVNTSWQNLHYNIEGFKIRELLNCGCSNYAGNPRYWLVQHMLEP
jgi:hypothetical protein